MKAAYLILALLLIVAVIAGCSSTPSTPGTTIQTNETPQTGNTPADQQAVDQANNQFVDENSSVNVGDVI